MKQEETYRKFLEIIAPTDTEEEEYQKTIKEERKESRTSKQKEKETATTEEEGETDEELYSLNYLFSSKTPLSNYDRENLLERFPDYSPGTSSQELPIGWQQKLKIMNSIGRI